MVLYISSHKKITPKKLSIIHLQFPWQPSTNQNLSSSRTSSTLPSLEHRIPSQGVFQQVEFLGEETEAVGLPQADERPRHEEATGFSGWGSCLLSRQEGRISRKKASSQQVTRAGFFHLPVSGQPGALWSHFLARQAQGPGHELRTQSASFRGRPESLLFPLGRRFTINCSSRGLSTQDPRGSRAGDPGNFMFHLPLMMPSSQQVAMHKMENELQEPQ